MENINEQRSIVRLPQLGLIAIGISLVIITLVAEPYMLNIKIVILAISFGLLLVEGTLLSIIYRSLISKKEKLKHWSKKNLTVVTIVTIAAFVWTLMLYEICKVVWFNLNHRPM
jgi:Mn2+/Fe2+ NRAMP family transporter